MLTDTIPARLLAHATARGEAPAYYVRAESGWQATNWRTFVDEARRAARALIAIGYSPGQTIAIIGFNRPEWVIADHAAMLAGGAAAGVYTTCSAEEVAYILGHAASHAVFVEDRGQWEKVNARRADLPELRAVIGMRGMPDVDDPLFVSWDAFMKRGDDVSEAALDERVAAIRAEAVATLIYTSGTTGPPKAVMLSHANLAWTAGAARTLCGIHAGDSALSYLPLSHIAEQMFTIHVPATCGNAVYFARSMEKLLDDLREVQPTVFFGVPRVWEKMHAGIAGKLKAATGIKKRLADWAIGVGGRATAELNAGRPVPFGLGLQQRLAERLVLRKVRTAIGLGDARFCVSGAAPIAPDVLEFFAGFGLPIHEVYGQSEGSGPTSFNQPGRTRFGTVGPPVPGVEVTIAADGEICVRGPNVFLGYYKEPVATGETLVDGWLRSGDLGRFDEQGFLEITGRKKDIIITAGGKNIAPKNIEAELKTSPAIAEAIVIGDRRRFLCALLVLDETVPRDDAALQAHVDLVNAKFARVEHVRQWRVLPRPLSIADGELTPTLKIKRKKVEEHFAALLDEIYAADAPAD